MDEEQQRRQRDVERTCPDSLTVETGDKETQSMSERGKHPWKVVLPSSCFVITSLVIVSAVVAVILVVVIITSSFFDVSPLQHCLWAMGRRTNENLSCGCVYLNICEFLMDLIACV